MLEIKKLEPVRSEELIVHLKRDFPAAERVPMAFMRPLIYSGEMKAFYLMLDGKVAGYSICQTAGDYSYALVMYFAILPQYRGASLGGSFLELINEVYKNKKLLLEVEDPDYSSKAADYITKSKRIRFYNRSGFNFMPGYRVNQAGTKMLLMTKSGQTDDNAVEFWKTCYQNVLGSLFANLIRVYPYPYDFAGVKPGMYRHFKGGMYKVITVAKHSETDEYMVVYKPANSKTTWVRPAAMWNEYVEHNGKRVKRFTYSGR